MCGGKGPSFVKQQPRKRKPTKKSGVKRWVTPQTKQMLTREAAKLGLNTDEYLRLVGNLSATLRQGLADGDQIDAKKLVEWAENPLVMSMIQWVCKSALKSVGQSDDKTSTDASKGNETGAVDANPSPAEPQQTAPADPNVQRQPQMYVDPWYGPMPY